MIFRYNFHFMFKKNPPPNCSFHMSEGDIWHVLFPHAVQRNDSSLMSHFHLKHGWYLCSLLCQLTADPVSCLLIWKMIYCLPLCDAPVGLISNQPSIVAAPALFQAVYHGWRSENGSIGAIWLHTGVIERESDIWSRWLTVAEVSAPQRSILGPVSSPMMH